TIQRDPEHDTAVVRAGEHAVLLQQGEWSEWIELRFDALPFGLMPLYGAVRFYAKELRPRFELYVSAVNFSAARPPQVFTSPEDWAEQLYAALGQFYTVGMPEETSALRDGVFDDDDYVR